MAEVTDPPPADRGGIDGAGGLDLTGLTTGVPVYSSAEEAAGVASPSEPRGLSRNQTRGPSRPGCPLSGQDATRKRGGIGPHQQPTAADPGPYSP
jgi:hypothetical protein